MPLVVPLSVSVEPTNVCNFRCEFCPESFPDYEQQAGYYHRLPMILFEVIVSELKSWDKINALKFCLAGEPLLNPDLPRMIRLAKDAEIANRLELTTNASLIDEQTARLLIESGLDCIRLSIYGLGESHSKVTGSAYTARQIFENVRTLRQVRDTLKSATPFLFAQYLAESPKAEDAFRFQYSGVVDEIGIELRHNWNGSDARLVTIGNSPLLPSKRVCPEPFHNLAIKANGDVSVCRIDWSGKLVVGNIREYTLREIWEGERSRSIQALHLAKKRSEIPACRNCTLLHNLPENLDALSEHEFMNRAGC